MRLGDDARVAETRAGMCVPVVNEAGMAGERHDDDHDEDAQPDDDEAHEHEARHRSHAANHEQRIETVRAVSMMTISGLPGLASQPALIPAT